MQDEQAISQLKELLLSEELKAQEALSDGLADIQKVWQDEHKFHDKLQPHFNDQISDLQERFPELFQEHIVQTIHSQIRESKKEIIDAMYPIVGDLVIRYLKAELETLIRRVDEQQEEWMSWESWKLRFQAMIHGISYREMKLRKSIIGTLEEVFVIEEESGLLMGHHSFNQLADADLISGMLTGIKSFVEHAFNQPEQQLKTLEYENYKILVYDFPDIYVACVVKGGLDQELSSKIQSAVFTFFKEHDLGASTHITAESQLALSQKLTSHFDEFNKVS
ncbi:MAG: hypothetical protein AAGI38_09885 [Bacteroidota bacterium]